MVEEIDLEKCNFWNFRSPVTLTLTLTLDQVTRHTVVHHSSTFIYTPNFIEIRKSFCGRTDVWMYLYTDGQFRPVGRLGGVNLIKRCLREVKDAIMTPVHSWRRTHWQSCQQSIWQVLMTVQQTCILEHIQQWKPLAADDWHHMHLTLQTTGQCRADHIPPSGRHPSEFLFG